MFSWQKTDAPGVDGRHPFFRFEFDPVRTRMLFRSLEHVLGTLGILAMIAFFWISPYNTHATIATFYPSSCLGGFENPSYAAGPPALSLDEARIEDFNKENSAFTNGSGELYCGNFVGDIPEEGIPKKFTLTLSWSADNNSVVHNDPKPIVIDTTPVLEDEKPDAAVEPSEAAAPPDDIEVIEVPNTGETETPPLEASTDTATPPPAPDATSTDALQSFLDHFFTKIVFAEELPAVDEPVAPLEESDTKEIEQPVPTTGDTIASEEAPPLVEGFMEVLYTLDATEWHSLGFVTMNNWRNISFDIPMTDWIDLSKLQIAFRPMTNIDPFPAVYLDGMVLSVSYEAEEDDGVDADRLTMTDATSADGNLRLAQRGGILDSEQVAIETTLSQLGNIALFDTKTGQIVLNTWTDQNEYVVDPTYLGVGSYAVVMTSDPDACSSRSFDTCLHGTDMVSSASFSIVKKRTLRSKPISPQDISDTLSSVLDMGTPAVDTPVADSEAPKTQEPAVAPPADDTADIQDASATDSAVPSDDTGSAAGTPIVDSEAPAAESATAPPVNDTADVQDTPPADIAVSSDDTAPAETAPDATAQQDAPAL